MVSILDNAIDTYRSIALTIYIYIAKMRTLVQVSCDTPTPFLIKCLFIQANVQAIPN